MTSKKVATSVLQRAASTAAQSSRPTGDISLMFPSLSGKRVNPLPQRMADLKSHYLKENRDAIQISWNRLLASLREEVELVKSKGCSIIPDLPFNDLAFEKVSKATADEVRQRGAAVIHNVIPQEEALALKKRARAHIQANRSRVRAFPANDPAVYELYWNPSQVTARCHPHILSTQTFLQKLWHSSNPPSQISNTHPLTYADRLRLRKPGDSKFALSPHTDGGSLERWEDPEYALVYHKILTGNWEQYDAFDAKHRLAAKMDPYNGAGACSMFRSFPGLAPPVRHRSRRRGDAEALSHAPARHATALPPAPPLPSST